MQLVRTYIKYLLICPLVIAFFIAAPVEASDSVKETKEEVEETKLYFKVNQTVKQKPKHRAERPGQFRKTDANPLSNLSQANHQPPKYILYCNLIFYE